MITLYASNDGSQAMTVVAAPVRERPILFSGEMVRAILDGRKTQTHRVIKRPEQYLHIRECAFCCPYGQPGDQLWVRESWAIDDCGNRVSLAAEAWPAGWPLDRLCYPATSHGPSGDDHWWNKRPSIHMPRWASRLTLEITEVRVERLVEISQADAMKEGTQGKHSFMTLWDELNAKRGYAVTMNPWVWVIGFRPVLSDQRASVEGQK